MEKQAKASGTSFSHRKVYKSVDVERGVEENEEEKNRDAKIDIDLRLKTDSDTGALDPIVNSLRRIQSFSQYIVQIL